MQAVGSEIKLVAARQLRLNADNELQLLGLQSNDIDIALSDMMGLQFAQHLATFAINKGVETGTISRIAQNPDQSKHLETATLKLFNLNIDLVNLRDEEYAGDSRIPTQVVRMSNSLTKTVAYRQNSLSARRYRMLCGET